MTALIQFPVNLKDFSFETIPCLQAVIILTGFDLVHLGWKIPFPVYSQYSDCYAGDTECHQAADSSSWKPNLQDLKPVRSWKSTSSITGRLRHSLCLKIYWSIHKTEGFQLYCHVALTFFSNCSMCCFLSGVVELNQKLFYKKQNLNFSFSGWSPLIPLDCKFLEGRAMSCSLLWSQCLTQDLQCGWCTQLGV